MADEAPKFAKYVSSVEGRLVSRPGSPHAYLGAATRSPDEIKAGKTEPSWTTDAVYPVLESEYLAYIREWDKLIRNGDLVERSADEYGAYQKKLEVVEEKRARALDAEAKKKADADAEAKKAADKAKTTGGSPAPQGGA